MAVFHRNSVRINRFLIFWIENNDYKTNKFKFQEGLKNGYFCKGVSPWICPKIELFLIGVFHRNYIREDGFWYCEKKSMILSGQNWTFKKSQKIDISQRG